MNLRKAIRDPKVGGGLAIAVLATALVIVMAATSTLLMDRSMRS